MSAVIGQLGLDATYFVQLVIVCAIFLLLGPLYFKPFMKLFDARHKRTVEDREAAERLLAQANEKFELVQKTLREERAAALKAYEEALAQSKRDEAALLSHARDEAKKLTQGAAEAIQSERAQLLKSLESEVERLAATATESLLSGTTPGMPGGGAR